MARRKQTEPLRQRRDKPLEPASSIVRRLGGEKSVHKIAGVSYTAPYRWQAPRERGGTGGLIPARHHPTLLRYARQARISLKASDFLPAS